MLRPLSEFTAALNDREHETSACRYAHVYYGMLGGACLLHRTLHTSPPCLNASLQLQPGLITGLFCAACNVYVSDAQNQQLLSSLKVWWFDTLVSESDMLSISVAALHFLSGL